MEEVKFELGLKGKVGICQMDLARKVILGRGTSKSHGTGKFWFFKELDSIQVWLEPRIYSQS